MADRIKPIEATVETLQRQLEEKPVLWVGAGASMAAGYPSTWSLLKILDEACDDDLDLSGDFPKVVDDFVASMGRGRLDRILQKTIAVPKDIPEFHIQVAKLAKAGCFSAIVTTNYDDLLERALRNHGVEAVLQTLGRNEHIAGFRLIKVHGSYDDWREVVLSGESYQGFADRYAFLGKQLDILLTQHGVVFVGCSMLDPRLLDWLLACDAARLTTLDSWRPMMVGKAWNDLAGKMHEGQPVLKILARGPVRPMVMKNHDQIPVLFRDVAAVLAPEPTTTGAGDGTRKPPDFYLRMDRVFVGRDEELGRIRAAFELGDTGMKPVAICALQGMPGVGKSYLAERFIQIDGARLFPGGVVRVVFAQAEARSVAEILADLADQVKLGDVDGAALAEALRLSRTLVLIENADDDRLGGQVHQIADRLQGCALLVTGRYRNLGLLTSWTRVQTEPLSASKGLDLLRRELGDGADRYAEADLVALSNALGHLPLALHLAAGYLAAGQSCSRFLERLRQSGLGLKPVDGASVTDARDILHTSFALSFEALAAETGQVDAFCALAHASLSGFGNSLGAAIAGLEEGPCEDLCVAAAGLSLLERLPEPGRWRFHRLLAEWARTPADEKVALKRTTDWFVYRLPQSQNESWHEIHAEYTALADWLRRVPKSHQLEIVRISSQFAQSNGPYRLWYAFYEEFLEFDEAGLARPEILWALGKIAFQMGGTSRARHYAELALKDKSKNQFRIFQATGLIAEIMEQQVEIDEALRIRQQEGIPVSFGPGENDANIITFGQIADLIKERSELGKPAIPGWG